VVDDDDDEDEDDDDVPSKKNTENKITNQRYTPFSIISKPS
jgi:hypothetical protein